TRAACTVESVSGKIKVSILKKGKKKLEISVDVPEGTSAEVVFPNGKTKTLGAGSHQVSG
ncbi:MAG: hypothetical protein J6T11_03330, partial [Bacteroidaceae bacterium]|nr:hypothetical protein [Bacteroidaceae bacterium]